MSPSDAWGIRKPRQAHLGRPLSATASVCWHGTVSCCWNRAGVSEQTPDSITLHNLVTGLNGAPNAAPYNACFAENRFTGSQFVALDRVGCEGQIARQERRGRRDGERSEEMLLRRAVVSGMRLVADGGDGVSVELRSGFKVLSGRQGHGASQYCLCRRKPQLLTNQRAGWRAFVGLQTNSNLEISILPQSGKGDGGPDTYEYFAHSARV